jgi:predicted RNase H-like HicB family nuclease
MELTVAVHIDDDESYWADVIEIPGCLASGRTLEELAEALEEAIGISLDDPCISLPCVSLVVGEVVVRAITC